MGTPPGQRKQIRTHRGARRGVPITAQLPRGIWGQGDIQHCKQRAASTPGCPHRDSTQGRRNPIFPSSLCSASHARISLFSSVLPPKNPFGGALHLPLPSKPAGRGRCAREGRGNPPSVALTSSRDGRGGGGWGKPRIVTSQGRGAWLAGVARPRGTERSFIKSGRPASMGRPRGNRVGVTPASPPRWGQVRGDVSYPG